MLIRNKHDSQEIWVTNKFQEIIFLKPGQECEVDDAQWRGYLANYSYILEKLDTGIVEADESAKIASLTKQVETLTRLLEKITNSNINIDEIDIHKELWTELSKEELIKKISTAGAVKWLWVHWSIEKLKQKAKEMWIL